MRTLLVPERVLGTLSLRFKAASTAKLLGGRESI